MSKTIRRTLAAVFAVMLCFCLCACGEKAETEDIGKIMQQAQDNLSKAESYSYDMLMAMGLTSEGQTIEMDVTAEIDMIVSPAKMKMDMSMDMGEYNIAMAMYMVEENSEYTAYTGVDMGTGSMYWGKQTVATADEIGQYNASESADIYISNAKNFKKAGADNINGKAATKYTGTISGESLGEVMKNTNIYEQYASLGINEETVNSMINELGSMKITVWISDEDVIPVKFELDMTELMKTIMSKTMEAAGGAAAEVDVNKMVMTMEISNINAVEDFEIPAEALAAEPITE